MTTEHFTLQTARAATIADSNGRAALYLSTVSGAVVALAFIGQVAHVGKAFFLFVLALLSALVLLGVLTYLRLLQTAVEDWFYARAINRIRRHYVDLDPDAARWFLLTSCDDPPAVMVNMGLAAPGAKHSRWHLLSHTASMVAVVTSIIGGVFVALAADALSAGALPVAPAAGVGVGITTAAITAFSWHQARRWRAAEDSVPALFPSGPGPLISPHPRRQTRPLTPGSPAGFPGWSLIARPTVSDLVPRRPPPATSKKGESLAPSSAAMPHPPHPAACCGPPLESSAEAANVRTSQTPERRATIHASSPAWHAPSPTPPAGPNQATWPVNGASRICP